MDLETGTSFTKHLKPKIFVSSIQTADCMYGTYENLRLKMFSKKGTRFIPMLHMNLLKKEKTKKNTSGIGPI